MQALIRDSSIKQTTPGPGAYETNIPSSVLIESMRKLKNNLSKSNFKQISSNQLNVAFGSGSGKGEEKGVTYN
jgi:hypothetical protein